MSSTAIEWADAVWNPVVGCTPVSAGCLNCYAATMARRLEGMGRDEYLADIRPDPKSPGEVKVIRIAETRNGRAVFTGDVRTLEHRLADPLRWRKPRRIFVCSMADLFHEAVPFQFIDRVFAVAALCPQHQFLMLTKRPERMAEYLATVIGHDDWGRRLDAERRVNITAMALEARHRSREAASFPWPLPNVWLGTSVEDRPALARIVHLRKCPAAVRFISFEPLLEDLGDIGCHLRLLGYQSQAWTIVGGESGAKARPCAVAWIRGVVRQCSEANVPCFVKQVGSRATRDGAMRGNAAHEGPGTHREQSPMHLNDRKGGDPTEWPEDLRVRQMPVIGGAA